MNRKELYQPLGGTVLDTHWPWDKAFPRPVKSIPETFYGVFIFAMMRRLLDWTMEVLGRAKRAGKRLSFTSLFSKFQNILELNNQILELMAEMGDKLGGEYVFDRQYIQSASRQVSDLVYKLIYNMNTIAPNKYLKLNDVFRRINEEIEEELAGRLVIPQTDYVIPYDLITRDFADVVGGKNANIAELKNQLGLTIPEGFGITTRAFKSFIEHNDLNARIESFTAAWKEGNLSSREASRTIQSLIMAGTIPPEVKKAIEEALFHLQELVGTKDLYLAIRSSAWGEDSEHTFAGQYLSLLNEPREKVLSCYRDVLASTYSESAMEYRLQKGFQEHEVVMAVACQSMIDGAKSGVLYTLDPLDLEREKMLITSIWGLGAPVVGGKVKADRFTVFREPPHEISALDIVRKPESLVPKVGGGCEFKLVGQDLQTKTSLSSDEIKQIAEVGLLVERYFKKPQDIEWVFDQEGKLIILQARSLNIRGEVAERVHDISSILENYPVIFADRGEIAENGIATGKVFLVKSDKDLDRFPQGAILVARQASPRFAKVVRKANGIITDLGSPTGHMATIAREFRVPTIVDTGIATDRLKQDQEITMDAGENVIYAGIVKELVYHEFTEETFHETYEYRLLRRVLKKISPLNLLDPLDKNFAPSGCRTFHDITRFIHEKAVEELIDLNYHHHLDPEAPGRKLDSDIPLDLIIIDIGGGFDETGTSRNVSEEHILSIPMRAFLSGLNMPGFWSSEPMLVDFGSFMSSITKTFSSNLASPKYIGQNLAVISETYANISLRLGYHFNMIDAYISDRINDNYAYFRFLGGVTDNTRRSRRVKFIAEVLAKKDFRVDLRGDLVVARVKKLESKAMEEKLHIIGQLVAFTRQLDVLMTSDQQIGRFVGKFDRLTRIGGPVDGMGGPS